jgi:predicted phosphodiesterase
MKKSSQTNAIGSRFKTVLVLSDMHCPFHDSASLSSVKALIAHVRPDYLVFNGDIIDNYNISSFDKNPKRTHGWIQAEIDITYEVLKWLVEAAPESTKLFYISGNHEDRYERMLNRDPNLASMRALGFIENLRLEELNIQYVKELVLYKKLLIKHGALVGKYAAARELDSEGLFGVSGHVHRNQLQSRMLRNGHITWVCVGHLCDVAQMDYIKYTPDWQQSVALVYIRQDGGGAIHPNVIEINNHKLIFNSLEFSPNLGDIAVLNRAISRTKKRK